MTMTARPPTFPTALRTTGNPRYSTTLERVPESAAIARLAVRTTLECWGISGETCEAATVVLSELVTNAVIHGEGASVLVVIERIPDDRVYLAVVDRDAYKLPVLKAPSTEEDSGRGLLLVEALSDRCGYDRLGTPRNFWGKRCWAELEEITP